jgi:fructokinase
MHNDVGTPGLDVGVELGGTKVIVAASRNGVDLVGREQLPTSDPTATFAAIRTAMGDVASGEPVRSVGVASFGPIDLRLNSPSRGTILSTPKPEWSGVNVLTAVAEGLNIPVGLDTDVNAAVRAEGTLGDHHEAAIAYLTVGTGVGGGVWVDGDVVKGSNHPEIGHLRVPRYPHDDFAGVCPFHGDCLEGSASGTAIRARWGRPAEALGESLDDAIRLEAWYLAHGIAGLCSVVPVEKVIIGGGVSHLAGLHSTVAAALPEASGGYPPIPFGFGGPVICSPTLGDNAGVMGAIALGRKARDSTGG